MGFHNRAGVRAKSASSIALIVLVAALFPGSAAAGPDASYRLQFKREIMRKGETWLMTVTATRFSGVTVAFTTDKKRRTAEGNLAYDLTERHRYLFRLSDTSEFRAQKGGCYEQAGRCRLGGHLLLSEAHDRGSLNAEIRFEPIPGEPLRTDCTRPSDGAPMIRTREVATTSDSTFVFKTGHPRFGTIKGISGRGVMTWSSPYTGPCEPYGFRCPVGGEHVYSRQRSGDESFRWHAALPDGEGYALFSARSMRVVGPTALLDQSHSGRVQRWRVDVAADVSKGVVRLGKLPRLSGKAILSPSEAMRRRKFYCEFQSDWDGDFDSYRYKAQTRVSKDPNDASGSLTYDPRGGEPAHLKDPWEKQRFTVQDAKFDGIYRVDY